MFGVLQICKNISLFLVRKWWVIACAHESEHAALHGIGRSIEVLEPQSIDADRSVILDMLVNIRCTYDCVSSGEEEPLRNGMEFSS